MSDLTADATDAIDATDAGAADFRVVVNGLDMSAATWARMVTAIRGLFAETAGLSDAAAVQLVMKNVATGWVAAWEERQASVDPGVAAQQAAEQANALRSAAHAQAVSDLNADVQPTVTS
jgi:predicted Zn-dependent protease